MGLTLQQSTTPFIYASCLPGDETSIYAPTFCAFPREFREELSDPRGFYYDPNTDTYRLLSMAISTAWPGWTVNVYEIDAETGQQIQVTRNTTDAINVAWTLGQSTGAFGRIYANAFVAGGISEVNPASGVPDGSHLANLILTHADIGGHSPLVFALNRKDNIIAFFRPTGQLTRWDYSTNTELNPIAMPYFNIDSIAYESDELAWCLQPSSDNSRIGIVKVNYKDPAIEGYSVLDASLDGPDIGALIAYDTLRKTVAVFREKANNIDGSAAHRIDFYKPIAKPTFLTAPTPLKKVLRGATVPMLAHLVGEVGEGGGGRQVTMSNSGTGRVLQKAVGVKANGTIPFLYQASDSPGTDTISLETTV